MAYNPDFFSGLTLDQISKMLNDARMFGAGHSLFTGAGFEHKPYQEVYYGPTAPRYGAIDYRRRPDGVWEMPK